MTPSPIYHSYAIRGAIPYTQIPKCLKARGCADTIKHLRGSTKLWVETKYDGERAQIHVEVDERGKSRITIFSKSRRDSTMDRFGVHQCVYSFLFIV